MHFGLLPRANRGIFAINELPDLAGKIQVGLFNILQEGDVQIKGYPVRLPLDVMVVFSANPEDYTARGKIITPLKDRIGAEIRTHYLSSRAEAMAITAQEAWTERGTAVQIPAFVREAVEELAFQARQDRRVDKRSGVSQRMPISVLESVVSNAERRALAAGETPVVPRVIDLYAALPSMTGKLELEYEGELKGADQIGRELIRAAVSTVFDGHFPDADTRADRRVVRPGRLAEPRRPRAGGGRSERGAQGAGAGRDGATGRHSAGCAGAAGRRGDRLRARGPVRSEEDQPQRRSRLSRRGSGASPRDSRSAHAGAHARR